MIGYVFNPPRSRGRRKHRKSTRRSRRKLSSSVGMAWKRAVVKYGVRGAALRRRKRRAAARKARRTIASRKITRKVVPMARRRRRVKRARRARGRTRRSLRKNMAENPRKRRRSRRKARRSSRRTRRSRRATRRNPVRRARRGRRSHRRSYRRNSWPGQPIRHRRAAKRAWRRHRRTMLPAVRKNVRRALNKKFGKRNWVKHSRAKWNPGLALSVKGVGRSISEVFNIENLYDGLAIGGGIIGALSLPRIVDRYIPVGIKAKIPFGISLSSGWFSYVAMAGSSGLLGYLAGAAFGRRYGEKVFWGGIGATLAKLVLDLIPGVKGFTGASMGAYDASLQKVIEEEVAAELAAGGGMGAYVTPEAVAGATSLGDFVSPADVMAATSLGGIDEFGEGDDFES